MPPQTTVTDESQVERPAETIAIADSADDRATVAARYNSGANFAF